MVQDKVAVTGGGGGIGGCSAGKLTGESTAYSRAPGGGACPLRAQKNSTEILCTAQKTIDKLCPLG